MKHGPTCQKKERLSHLFPQAGGLLTDLPLSPSKVTQSPRFQDSGGKASFTTSILHAHCPWPVQDQPSNLWQISRDIADSVMGSREQKRESMLRAFPTQTPFEKQTCPKWRNLRLWNLLISDRARSDIPSIVCVKCMKSWVQAHLAPTV